ASGSIATYKFDYVDTRVARRCPYGVERDDQIGVRVTTSFLKSVTLPDGSTYTIPNNSAGLPDYEYGPSDQCSSLTSDQRSSGNIKSMQLPTFGKVEWSWV